MFSLLRCLSVSSNFINLDILFILANLTSFVNLIYLFQEPTFMLLLPHSVLLAYLPLVL